MRKVRNLQKQPFPLSDVITKTIPASVDGWDAISPLASMSPSRAVILDNFVPRPGWVELRQGYATWSGSFTSSPVETLMVYRPPNASEKLFAATNGQIWDVSVFSLANVHNVVSGLSNNRWQYVNFTPAGGTTVIQLCNGLDPLYQYNGTSWTIPSITGLPGTGTTSNIINIASHKRRLWYILANSTVAAYMPTDAIQGPIAGTVDLGALWTKGGYLVAMANWTSDGGLGPQDYAAFISSRGQITLYTGTDPTNSAAWAIVGTFSLAPPLGRRCTMQIGSDIGIITLQGVLPISQALPFDPSADRSVAITARIQNAMAQTAAQAQNSFGWEMLTFPAQQLLILNVPVSENLVQYQYVSNMLTGAWCRFTGWNANTFAIYNDKLFFGANTDGVFQAYTGGLDNSSAIAATMQTAYQWFDDPGRTKRMTMIQPLIVANGSITPFLSIDTDFVTSTTVAPLSILQGGALWDSALWDQSSWPGQTVSITDWHSVEALGHALAVHLSMTVATGAISSAPSGFDQGRFDTSVFDAVTSNDSEAPTFQVNAFNSILEFGGYI